MKPPSTLVNFVSQKPILPTIPLLFWVKVTHHHHNVAFKLINIHISLVFIQHNFISVLSMSSQANGNYNISTGISFYNHTLITAIKYFSSMWTDQCYNWEKLLSSLAMWTSHIKCHTVHLSKNTSQTELLSITYEQKSGQSNGTWCDWHFLLTCT